MKTLTQKITKLTSLLRTMALVVTCAITCPTRSIADYAFTLPAGYSAIGNPYNSVASFDSFMTPIDGMLVLKFIQGPQIWSASTYDSGFGGWIDSSFNPIAAPSFNSGEGCFFFNPNMTYTQTIVGTPAGGIMPTPPLNTWCFVTAKTGAAVSYYADIFGAAPPAGTCAVVAKWNGSSFEFSKYRSGVWTPSSPPIPLGSAVMVQLIPDTLTPFVPVSAAPNCTLNQIVVCFNKDIDTSTAALPAQYTLTITGAGSLPTVSSVTFDPSFSGIGPVLSIRRAYLNLSGPLTSGSTYTVAVSGVTDLCGDSVVSGASTVFIASQTVPRLVLAEPDCNNNEVIVNYDRSMGSGANNPANYVLIPGGIQPTSASLIAPDVGTGAHRVRLTFPALNPSTLYALQANNVFSTCGAPIPPGALVSLTCNPAISGLSGVYPSSVGGCAGTTTIRIVGSGLQAGSIVKLKQGVAEITATIVILQPGGFLLDAAFGLSGYSGVWDVEVTPPVGAAQTIASGLTITAAPSLFGASPSSVSSCGSVVISSYGNGICPTATLKLVRGMDEVVGSTVTVDSYGTTVSGTFNLVGAALGTWNLVVSNPGGGSYSLVGSVNVVAPALHSVSPNVGGTCPIVTLTANVSKLCSITSFKLVKAGESDRFGSSPTLNGAGTVASATFDLTTAAVGSVWDVVITAPSGVVLTLPSALTIASSLAFTLNTVVPNRGGNCGTAELNFGGVNMPFPMSVKLVRAGQTDIVGSPTGFGGHLGLSMAARFDLNGAALGVWDVVLVNNCHSVTLPGAFTVAPIAIRLIQPVFGKECLSAAVDISGSCFAAGATVKLKKTGSTPITGVNTFVNSGLIKTVFNLTGAATGLWDVEVTNPNNDTTTLAGTFTVLPCTGCNVDVSMSVPSRVSAGRAADFSICYVNHGVTTLNNVNISVADIPADAVINIVSSSPAAMITSPGGGLPQTISFIVPSLAAGQSACYYFKLTTPTMRPPVQLTGKVTSPCVNSAVFQYEVLASGDPNDKFGLVGNGDNHHMLGTETLPYEIVFENKPEATAPAQEIFVTDYIDPSKLDLSTFSLGTVTFGTHTVVAPPGLNSWTTYVPYTVNAVPADDILVKIICALVTNPIDPNYGKLTWSLLSIDPVTGLLPTDPLRGFLPPNTSAPLGQGSVTYSVKAKSTLVTGDVIGNNASIVFDLNPPILTPAWINVIDKTAPVSSVTALPALQAATSFTVDWSGSDVGSGIASYDVFVSDNNGPFTAWLSGANTTTGTYNGVGGHTYRFYSVAKDGVGHIETSPVSPDATTMVRPWLSLSRSGNNIIVTWEGAGGTLQEAGEVNGVWADIIGATSPYSCEMYPTNHFYRLRP